VVRRSSVVEDVEVSDEAFQAAAIPGGQDDGVGVDTLACDEQRGFGLEAFDLRDDCGPACLQRGDVSSASPGESATRRTSSASPRGREAWRPSSASRSPVELGVGAGGPAGQRRSGHPLHPSS
jgi:hypothetical protein